MPISDKTLRVLLKSNLSLSVGLNLGVRVVIAYCKVQLLKAQLSWQR